MICDISPRANGEMYSERFVCTSGSPMTNLNDQNDYIEGRFTGYTTNSYESLADYNAKIVAVKGSEVKVLGAADHYYLKQFPNWGYIGWNAESNGKPYATVPLDNGEWELMIATYEYDTDEMVSYHPLPMRPFFIISDGVFTEKVIRIILRVKQNGEMNWIIGYPSMLLNHRPMSWQKLRL